MFTNSHQNIIVTVDVVIFTVCNNKINTLLLKRDKEPYLDCLAIPGGFVHQDEDTDSMQTAKRVLSDKIGCEDFFVEQLNTYANKTRDPRGWSASIVYYSLVNYDKISYLLNENKNLILTDINNLNDFAIGFDHKQIILDALKRLQGKGSYSSLPTHLLDDVFTLPQLQNIYEIILGCSLDKSSFRRKIDDLGFIKEVNQKDCKSKRPAKLYTLNENKLHIFNRNI